MRRHSSGSPVFRTHDGANWNQWSPLSDKLAAVPLCHDLAAHDDDVSAEHDHEAAQSDSEDAEGSIFAAENTESELPTSDEKVDLDSDACTPSCSDIDIATSAAQSPPPLILPSPLPRRQFTPLPASCIDFLWNIHTLLVHLHAPLALDDFC